jgi:hypothetical protein
MSEGITPEPAHENFSPALGASRQDLSLVTAKTRGNRRAALRAMIRKLKTGKYRLYSREADPKTGKRRNLGTFDSRDAAQKHERAVQYFKRAG